jgi:hypothetical protein
MGQRHIQEAFMTQIERFVTAPEVDLHQPRLEWWGGNEASREKKIASGKNR